MVHRCRAGRGGRGRGGHVHPARRDRGGERQGGDGGRRAAQGRLDILVNAAGIEIEKTIEQTSLADWNRIFAINVTGTFLVSKHALPLLRRPGKARS
ncbi:MAG: SDR family NAD(P)-dependent oxidoreductase [Hyphomicrobiaceae bacterium]